MRNLASTGNLLVFSISVSTTFAQEFTIAEDEIASLKADYSPFVDQHYPQRVWWGDTHLHTANSPDAGLIGNTLGPDMAYRFARGEEVTSSTGLRTKLIKPLDFLAVTDHAEYMGLGPGQSLHFTNLVYAPIDRLQT